MFANTVRVADSQMVDRRFRVALGVVGEGLEGEGGSEAYGVGRTGFTNLEWLACERFVLW